VFSRAATLAAADDILTAKGFRAERPPITVQIRAQERQPSFGEGRQLNTSLRFHADVHRGLLWKDGELLFCRGWRYGSDGGRSSALALLPASDQPSSACLDRLAHEFELKDELDGDWAVRALELAREGGCVRLVLEDPGGEPLERLLGKPMDVGRFLRFAIGIAAAIGSVHQRGLVHKDIKPAHILVNCPDGHFRLTGFGLASRLLRERQTPTPFETIAGTLAYMAPEQTGRMNRSIDSRSDLYSLGVTFYQMLTGTLPFTASDPVEWVHCHIARQPLAPSEHLQNVPNVISQLVMKLLGKTPEERYQTAGGVEYDLQHCLTDWEHQQRIGDFVLGQHDTPDRLLIPEKLYGREHEVNTLLACFDRVAKDGAPELVLVSGYSGIGKSSVINELHKVLALPRGLFASGKFDQYKRDIPYATLAQAFQNLIRPLLSQSDAELSGWREALLGALGPSAGLITDLIPELKLIIGDPPPVPELEPQQAQSRFQLVFRRFIGVFAQAEHPMALFFDDLQWVDNATLDLLEDLLIRSDLKYLMLIGAYRDNEVDAAHSLTRKLSAIRQAGARVHQICLPPLARDDIKRLIADAFRCDPARVGPLAQLIGQKTAGNPFFVVQFLRSLSEEGLIRFDYEALCWWWDLDRIDAKGYTDNVVDLLVGKLNRLPAETRHALQQLACIGNVAPIATLSAVVGTPEEQMRMMLWPAVRQELIEPLEGSYRFIHDRVQEAAYSLIPQSLRAEVHLRIGRLLVRQTPSANREESIFDIVNQLNRGAALIDQQEERDHLAELNLIAGRRAKASTAYTSALTYLNAGAALLAEGIWERRRELVFALELNRAECEFLTGQSSVAVERLAALSNRTTTTAERAVVACLHIDVCATLGETARAVDLCLDYLRHVGIEWSAHPNEETAEREYERVWSLLGGRAIEDLIDLPLMEDLATLATMDVLAKVHTSARFMDGNLTLLLLCKAVDISLERGNCDASCFAYAQLGELVGRRFGDYHAGFRFGQVGYRLVERHGLKRFMPGTYEIFAFFIAPWMQPVRASEELMRHAIEAALKIGDLTMASLTWDSLNSLLFFAGEPLPEVQAEAERCLAFAENLRFGRVIDFITPLLALIRMLRGFVPNFGCFDDGQFNELAIEDHLSSSPVLATANFGYWNRKLQARFVSGDYSAAMDAAAKLQRLPWMDVGVIEEADYHLYGALAHAAYLERVSAIEQPQHLDAIAGHHRQLQVWSKHCPENFGDRAALVGAEIARLEGRHLDAEFLYEQAIRLSRDNGFIQNEGIAYERASEFYRARGLDQFADLYLGNARHCYLRWGAAGKLRQLDARHPGLAMTDAHGGSTIPPWPDRQLDVAAVVKASQTLSEEMLLPRLIERLMTIALQNAGAERGLLILIRDGEPRIEAEAATGLGTIEVAARHAAITPTDVPQSVLHYTMRALESVLLGDASADDVYSKDEYVRQMRSKSILCLPILKQRKLVGALYLENSLAPFVFTPDRVAVLQLLASQAAISLENAHLYSNLELQAGLLQRLPVSAWTLEPDGKPDFVNQVWLEYSGQTLDFVRSHPEAWMTAVHPEDREAASRAFWEGVRSGQGFAIETRSLRAQDGSYRWHLQQAVVLRDAEGKVLRFIGTTTDIDDQKRVEDALRQAQGDLARINRVTTMGELAASLAHELSQPISGAMTNANTCLRKLGHDKPDLDDVRTIVSRIARDAHRASDVIGRIRSQFQRGASHREVIDVNEISLETVALLRDEAARYNISVRTELAADLPHIVGDRVQLQQVAMNLIVNSIEAMKEVNGIREMVIKSQRAENEHVLVSLSDTGSGFPPQLAEQLFDPFFTTKPQGTGMGLRISRSIVESHGGRLWAVATPGHGATFHLSLPATRNIPPSPSNTPF
jgi:PAS domain S-box-containing protein